MFYVMNHGKNVHNTLMHYHSYLYKSDCRPPRLPAPSPYHTQSLHVCTISCSSNKTPSSRKGSDIQLTQSNKCKKQHRLQQEMKSFKPDKKIASRKLMRTRKTTATLALCFGGFLFIRKEKSFSPGFGCLYTQLTPSKGGLK